MDNEEKDPPSEQGELRRVVEESVGNLQEALSKISLDGNYRADDLALVLVRRSLLPAIEATSRALQHDQTDDAGLADDLVLTMNSRIVQRLGTATERDEAGPITSFTKDLTFRWNVLAPEEGERPATADDLLMALRRIEMAIDSRPDQGVRGIDLYNAVVQTLTLLLTLLMYLNPRS